MSEQIVIPDKPAFKAAEVCELLKVPPYVLRSWENEFRDLGVSKTATGPRVYRREDVARALRIRDLVLSEGLTLAGVRRRLEQESGAPSAEDTLLAELAASSGPRGAAPVPQDAAPAVSGEWRRRVAGVRDGLREIYETLSRPVATTGTAVPARREAPASSAVPRTRAAAPRRAAAVAPPPPAAAPSSPPVRELIVEPDEPSLFGGPDIQAEPAGDAPVSRARGRRTS